MEKTKTKTVYSTGLPYSEVKWPAFSDDIADAILSLLVPLLKPIGDHGGEHVKPANNRGRPKQCCKRRKIGNHIESSQDRPEISSFLNLGFNSTIRMLEGRVGGFENLKSASEQSRRSQKGPKDPDCPAVVFVCRSSLPDPVSQSLPVLIATASHRTQTAQPIRLIELSAKAEAAVSAAVGLPRVSVLSVHHDAPDAGPLLHLIQEHIEPVDVPWLKEVPSSTYLPVKLNAVEANIGSKESSRKRKRASR